MKKNERKSISTITKILLGLITVIGFSANILLFVLMFGTILSIDSIYFKITYILFYLLAICLILIIIRKPINVNYKLTWSIFMLLLPVPFTILYLINAFSRGFSKRKRLNIQKKVSIADFEDDKNELWSVDSLAANIVSAVQKSTYAPVYHNVKYKYFNDIADKFQDLLYETSQAKHYIFIEYFTISTGKLWDLLYPILLERGKNNVKIKILYDDIGSMLGMRKCLLKSLEAIPNCQINSYEKVGATGGFLLNYRDHRKIYVVDGRVAYCGGDNLADEYIHEKIRFGYWRDICGKYEGKIVHTFVQMFREMWYISTGEYIPDDIYYPNYDYEKNGFYMAFSDGPLYVGNPGYDLFMLLLSVATKSIYISTPYFIVDDALINMICLKAKSGVDVKILMPGIPDKRAAYYMGRGLYRDILKSGGQIFEYTPGFNHAKSIIIDNKYAYIGTLNFDYRSLFLHYECGALIMYDKEIDKMTEDFNSAVDSSKLVTYEAWKKRPFYQKFWAFIITVFNPMF